MTGEDFLKEGQALFERCLDRVKTEAIKKAGEDLYQCILDFDSLVQKVSLGKVKIVCQKKLKDFKQSGQYPDATYISYYLLVDSKKLKTPLVVAEFRVHNNKYYPIFVTLSETPSNNSGQRGLLGDKEAIQAVLLQLFSSEQSPLAKAILQERGVHA